MSDTPELAKRRTRADGERTRQLILDTAVSLNNLGFLYQEQKQYAAAEPLFAQALVSMEKTLGPEHPSVATALGNIALMRQHQKDYAAAEPLYQRAIAINEKHLKPNHPAVMQSYQNYANFLARKGDWVAATKIMMRLQRMKSAN